ncbi:MAG: GIY-YIG nuclease family protein [Candidatus Paceibacterota bacterium]
MAKIKKIKRNQILIKNYGLFWKKDDVFWGKQRATGRLLGILAGAKRSDTVDFRNQVGIYVLYADYKIVYIGQAGNGNAKLFARLKNHSRDDLAGRWNQFSWFGLNWVTKQHKLSSDIARLFPKTLSVLNHIEAILIHASEPPLNRQGGRWGKEVQRYLQYRDAELLGKSETELLKEIHKKIKNIGTAS